MRSVPVLLAGATRSNCGMASLPHKSFHQSDRCFEGAGIAASESDTRTARACCRCTRRDTAKCAMRCHRIRWSELTKEPQVCAHGEMIRSLNFYAKKLT